MEEDDIFRIASQTKAIVSAGIMALQERGALLVDDPVGRYLPEWMETEVAVDNDAGGVDVVPADRPITVRDLLTHTSGIPYGAWINPLTADAWSEAGIDGWYFASEAEPIREIVRRMADLPMVAQPGTEWLYGSNTDILGAVIRGSVGASRSTRSCDGPSSSPSAWRTRSSSCRRTRPTGWRWSTICRPTAR